MKKYKNHFILSVVLIVTIILLIYALNWYNVYKEATKNKAIISDYISEIKVEEFHNYINDNRNAVIYFGITDDEDCRQFEKSFRKSIKKYELTDRIVYISVNSWRDADLSSELNNHFNNKDMIKQGKKLIGVPILGIYENSQLVAFVGGNDLNKNSALDLLEDYNIISYWD